MAKGVLYKFNATTQSHSQSKKFNATGVSDGKIRHADASTFYDNYPMVQEYKQVFSAKWSNGWRGDGVKLDETAWYSQVLTGSTTGFRGMYGFDKQAIANFCAGGTITKATFHVHCFETTLNGSPDVIIGKHIFTSEPTGSWDGALNTSYYESVKLHVPNKATGGYMVTLNPSQIRWNNDYIGGIAMKGEANTDENMGKFSAWNSSYNTRLEITVLK